MHLRQGTCIKLSAFLENLIELSGTKNYLTRKEFDNNPDKICSYSYMNKTLGHTWNTLLEKAGLSPKRIWDGTINQGRKLRDTTKYREVTCLLCDELFDSFDPALNRICKKCKVRVNLEDGWDNEY